jgi:hypothetical protein
MKRPRDPSGIFDCPGAVSLFTHVPKQNAEAIRASGVRSIGSII